MWATTHMVLNTSSIPVSSLIANNPCSKLELEKTTHSTPLTARSTSSLAAPPRTHELSSALAHPLLPSQNNRGWIGFKDKKLIQFIILNVQDWADLVRASPHPFDIVGKKRGG